MRETREKHLLEFYEIIALIGAKAGGIRQLADCSGKMTWPKRGVYFFQEPGEIRANGKPRIVRVGTHALKERSSTSLWNRLSQHRGSSRKAGGNHRGSIFRLLIGDALIQKGEVSSETWGRGNSAARHIRESERPLEGQVSTVIGEMPFLWLAIEDAPGADSLRGYVERNSIALLSNYKTDPIDPPSTKWLGSFSSRERVRLSGLWNSNHVYEAYDPSFLAIFRRLVDEVAST